MTLLSLRGCLGIILDRAFKDYLNAVNVVAKNRWIMFASRSNRIDGVRERVESVFIRGARVIRGGK